jgi:hypothetical protein
MKEPKRGVGLIYLRRLPSVVQKRMALRGGLIKITKRGISRNLPVMTGVRRWEMVSVRREAFVAIVLWSLRARGLHAPSCLLCRSGAVVSV